MKITAELCEKVIIIFNELKQKISQISNITKNNSFSLAQIFRYIVIFGIITVFIVCANLSITSTNTTQYTKSNKKLTLTCDKHNGSSDNLQIVQCSSQPQYVTPDQTGCSSLTNLDVQCGSNPQTCVGTITVPGQTITFSNGFLIVTGGAPLYLTVNIKPSNCDMFGKPTCCPGGPGLTVDFSQPVSQAIINVVLTDANATFAVVDGGVTQTFSTSIGSGEFTINGTSITSVTVTAPTAPTVPDSTWFWNFGIASVGWVGTSQPTAGTIVANPSSSDPGTTINITGSGWTVTPSSTYQLLFDGNSVAQQNITACSDQPNLSFDIPCGASVGTHTITCNQGSLSKSINFIVTQPAIAPLVSCQPMVMFQQADGGKLPNPLRMGMPSKLSNRRVTIKAIVSPPLQLGDVEFRGSGLDITHQEKIPKENNAENIELEAQIQSSSPGDRRIKAFSKKDGKLLAEAPVSVLVPDKIGIPHQTTNEQFVAVKGINILGTFDTKPPFVDVKNNEVHLVAIYPIELTITVLDQFGMSGVGDLYGGSPIYEIMKDPKGKQLVININQTLSSSSTYTDPVGAIVYGDIVKADSQAATEWTSKQPKPIPTLEGFPQDIPIKVDEFDLTIGIVGRVVFIKPPNLIKIDWPNQP